MFRVSRFLLVALACCLFMGFPVDTFAADECRADLNPTLMREERGSATTKVRWRVEVSASARCADVTYDLIITESDSQGHDVQKVITRLTRCRDGVRTNEMINHKRSNYNNMIDWKVEFRSCSLCGAAKTD